MTELTQDEIDQVHGGGGFLSKFAKFMGRCAASYLGAHFGLFGQAAARIC